MATAETGPGVAGDPGTLVEPDDADPRVRRVTFASAALGRRAECLVVTPDGWSADAGPAALPVLYLLHGSDDGPRCWLDKTDLLELSVNTNALVVLPEGGVVGYYTDWLHPTKEGDRPEWERFHLDEVPQFVLPRFTTTTRSVIGGLSMGGYGAFAYAARHPERFGAVASFSGLPHITRGGIPAFLAFVLRRQQEPATGPWGSPRADRAHWLAHDPYHLAHRLTGQSLYLATGDGHRADGDKVYPGSGAIERLIGRSTWSFAARLDELGIPYVASKQPGTHDWPYWRREFRRAWPFLAAELERLRTGGPGQ